MVRADAPPGRRRRRVHHRPPPARAPRPPDPGEPRPQPPPRPIKHNMRFRQLSVRGKPKAAAEWTFTAAVHNLFKAITTGHLTPATLAALPSRAGPQASPA